MKGLITLGHLISHVRPWQTVLRNGIVRKALSRAPLARPAYSSPDNPLLICEPWPRCYSQNVTNRKGHKPIGQINWMRIVFEVISKGIVENTREPIPQDNYYYFILTLSASLTHTCLQREWQRREDGTLVLRSLRFARETTLWLMTYHN